MEVSDYWLGVVLEPYRELPLGASEEACTVHNTVLKPSNQFIVVQWFKHDRWMTNGSREFKTEMGANGQVMPPYVLWQQGSVIPIKLGSIPIGQRKVVLSKSQHEKINAILKPVS